MAKSVDVFISYASQDRERARQLADALTANGLSVWWDEHLAVGSKWEETLMDRLIQPKSVIVLWTKNAIASEWVLPEAGYARVRDRLLNVLADDVTPPAAFASLQAADLRTWDGTADGPAIEVLAKAVRWLKARHRKFSAIERNLLAYGERGTPWWGHA